MTPAQTVTRHGSRSSPIVLGGIVCGFALIASTILYVLWATFWSGALVTDPVVIPAVPPTAQTGPGEVTIPCRAIGPLGLTAAMNPLRITLIARGSFRGWGHEDAVTCRVLDSSGRLVSVLDATYRTSPVRNGSGRSVRGIVLGEFEVESSDLYTIEPAFHVWRGLPRARLRWVVRRNVASADARLIVAGSVGALLSLAMALVARSARRSIAEERAAA